MEEGLRALNARPGHEAEAALLACCGSRAWARRMAVARPFANLEGLLEAADRTWRDLQPSDWLEAFAAHPRIGQGARQPCPAAARDTPERWWSQEQSGTRHAPDAVLQALGELNEAYLTRFGYIFIICATGRSAEEMLSALRARLSNDPDTELAIAAEEQRKITELRLVKLTAA